MRKDGLIARKYRLVTRSLKVNVWIDFPKRCACILSNAAYAVLNIPNSISYVINSKGIPFRTIALNQTQMPIITVVGLSNGIVMGKPLPVNINQHVLAAYYLLGLLGSRQIGQLSDLEGINVDPNDNVSLVLHNQLLIKLGQADGLPDRLTSVETALTADPSLATKAVLLDFTTSRPAIKEKAPTPTALPTTPPAQ